MRRWLLLLAVMELAALALYVPSLPDLVAHPAAILYPEKLLKVEWKIDQFVLEQSDHHRDQRCAVGMASYAVMTGCWLVGLYWLSRSRGRLDRGTLLLVLAGAAVVAVTLWGLPPTFSNDSYRYRFDGLATIKGYNPYEFKPDSVWHVKKSYPELFWSSDFRWRTTLYGPFVVFLFGINALFGNTMLGLRVILLLAEGLLAYALLGILRRRGAEAGWLAAVVLCPLLIMETHLDGHLELIPVALTVAGIFTLNRRQWGPSAVLLALAVNVKYLWPGLAAFLLLGRLARQKRLVHGAAAFCLTAGACWLPFMLLSWLSAGGSGPAVEGLPKWMPLPVRLVLEAPRQFLERPNYNATYYQFMAEQFHPDSHWPKLIALAVLLALTGLLIWRRRWRMDLEDIVLVLGVAIMISPISYPWYFIWLVPGLAVLAGGELWSRIGPPVWLVLYLALVPALHEFWAAYFRHIPGVVPEANPFPLAPWLIVAAVTPLLAVAWTRRLSRPVFGR